MQDDLFGRWHLISDVPPPVRERILVCWPLREIGADYMPTGKIVFMRRVMAEWDGKDWEEPEWMATEPNADFWGNDYEAAAAPMYWTPILPEPENIDMSPLPGWVDPDAEEVEVDRCPSPTEGEGNV